MPFLLKGFMGLTGVDSVLLSLQPRANLARRQQYFIPVSSDQSTSGFVSPLNVRSLFRLVFLLCSFIVAHRQFSLLYGPSLSTLSIVMPLGNGAIS